MQKLGVLVHVAVSFTSPLFVVFQGCAFFMPSVGSSLAIGSAVASTRFVPDLR